MRRHKKSPKKMQTQVFRYALLLPLLALILFSVIVYFYFSDILIDREHVAMQNLNSSQLSQIDANLQNLDYVTADINYVNRLTGFLTDSSDWSSQEVRNWVLSIVGSERRAYQVTLIPLTGEAAEMGIADDGEAFGDRDAAQEQAVQDMQGLKVIGTPQYTAQHSYGGSRRWLLTVSRAALNAKNEVIGTLETFGRCEQIFAPAISYSRQKNSTATLYIFDEDGTQVYPYDTTEEEKAVGKQIYRLTTENPDTPEEVKNPDTGEIYQYVRTRSGYSGWSYVTLQPRSVIFQPVHRLIALLVFVGILLFILTAMAAWLFARQMARPVLQLKELVQHVRLDTLGQVQTQDRSAFFKELDDLFGEFQTMSESLEASLEELQLSRQLEFKSQMTALQMQMNPHFYYNTLSCISVLAENGQTEEVSSMCRTLSDLMRYITDLDTSEVMLFQELGIVQKYLYCMKMRYQDSLNITLESDDRLNAIPIPKLILQPLVENAVKYGTDCLPPWDLKITGVMEEDRWYFKVEDSGNGFSAAAMRSLEEQIREIDGSDRAELAPQKIGGMGMINVYFRWKLFCRGDEIFEYGNNEEGHAYVIIGRRLS